MIEPVHFAPHASPEWNEAVGGFVANVIWGEPRHFGPYASMGVFEDGSLIGGTIYHNWDMEHGVIELTSAATSPRWLTRKVIKAMFSLPFDGLGCQMIVLRVSEKNRRMQRIARSFGFAEYLIPRLRGRDEDEFIFTYTDDQWRDSPYNCEAKATS